MKAIRIGTLAALVLVVGALGGALGPVQARSADTTPGGGITVSGSGSVTTVPDRASFTFGVTSQAKTAAAAMQQTSGAMQKVIAALKGAGVAAPDLQTTQISLSVRTSQDGQTITGYEASSSVSALVRDLGRAGAVVDAAVAAGANTVSGPALSRGDSGALYREALKQAVADAQEKAKALAAAAGVTLGRVTAISEGSQAPVPLPAAGKANATPVEPGTQEIDATVTVTFAVR